MIFPFLLCDPIIFVPVIEMTGKMFHTETRITRGKLVVIALRVSV